MIHWIIVTMNHAMYQIFHEKTFLFETYPRIPIIIQKAIDDFRDFKGNGKQMRIHFNRLIKRTSILFIYFL
jgi:hypothetical protein